MSQTESLEAMRSYIGHRQAPQPGAEPVVQNGSASGPRRPDFSQMSPKHRELIDIQNDELRGKLEWMHDVELRSRHDEKQEVFLTAVRAFGLVETMGRPLKPLSAFPGETKTAATSPVHSPATTARVSVAPAASGERLFVDVPYALMAAVGDGDLRLSFKREAVEQAIRSGTPLGLLPEEIEATVTAIQGALGGGSRCTRAGCAGRLKVHNPHYFKCSDLHCGQMVSRKGVA